MKIDTDDIFVICDAFHDHEKIEKIASFSFFGQHLCRSLEEKNLKFATVVSRTLFCISLQDIDNSPKNCIKMFHV